MHRRVATAAVLALLTPAESAVADTKNYRLQPGGSEVIYGARGESCSSGAPSLDWVLAEAFDPAKSAPPQHGTLSDGGIGKRYSAACKKDVPTRLIRYTADPGFAGEDLIVFWGTDTRRVIVAP